MHEVPSAVRRDESLKLVVYEKDFEPAAIELALRPIKTVVNIRKLPCNVKPLGKPDMYELSVDESVRDGTVLQVRSWSFENFGAIVLGDTQAELVKYFSQKNLPDAQIVVQYLDDALAAFSNNTELRSLHAYWSLSAKDEKDRQSYAYVEEKWQQYVSVRRPHLACSVKPS